MQEAAVAVPKKANGKDHAVLMPDRFGEAEFKRHDWVVDVPVGVSVEQLLDPAFWAHVASQMDPFDHIEARAEDGSWIAYLVVRICERNYAKVSIDRVLEFSDQVAEAPVSTKHKIEWKGPHHKYVVIRLADSQAVQSGFKSRYDAETWMRQHERGMEK